MYATGHVGVSFCLPPAVAVVVEAGVTGRRTTGGRGREGVIGTDAEVKIAAAGDKRSRGVDRYGGNGVISVADGSNLD